MNVYKTISCKWCGMQTHMLGTKECNRCWELRSRVERDPKLATEMLLRVGVIVSADAQNGREKRARHAGQ